jgi:hypothetical protein
MIKARRQLRPSRCHSQSLRNGIVVNRESAEKPVDDKTTFQALSDLQRRRAGPEDNFRVADHLRRVFLPRSAAYEPCSPLDGRLKQIHWLRQDDDYSHHS